VCCNTIDVCHHKCIVNNLNDLVDAQPIVLKEVERFDERSVRESLQSDSSLLPFPSIKFDHEKFRCLTISQSNMTTTQNIVLAYPIAKLELVGGIRGWRWAFPKSFLI
jgi:hypothetical protein